MASCDPAKGLESLWAQARYSEVITFLKPCIQNAATVTDLIQLGLAYLKQLDHENSQLVLQQALEAEPDNIQALYYLGLLNKDLGADLEASQFFAQAIALCPIDQANGILSLSMEQLLCISGCFYESKDYEKAYEYTQVALQKDADSYEAWIKAGISLSLLQRFPEAVQSFDVATRLRDDSYHAWSYKAITKFYAKKRERAAKINIGEMLSDLDKAVSINSDYFQAHLFRGQIYSTVGDYRKAFDEYACAAPGVLPRWPRPRTRESQKYNIFVEHLYDRHYNQGGFFHNVCQEFTRQSEDPYFLYQQSRFYLADRELQAALECIDKAITSDPNNYEYLCLKGEILLRDKQRSDAIKIFNDALDQSKQDPTAYLGLARCYFFEKRQTECINWCDNYLGNDLDTIYASILNAKKETKERVAELLTLKAEALSYSRNSARDQLAKSCLEYARRIDRKTPRPLHLLGDLYIRFNNPKFAIQQFQAGINRSNPNSSQHAKLLNSQSRAHRMLHQPEEAHECLVKSTQIAPDQYEAYRLLGEWHTRYGDKYLAYDFYKTAAENCENLKELLKQALMLGRMAQLLLGRGQLAQAEAMCSKALYLDPDNHEVLACLARICCQKGLYPRNTQLLETSLAYHERSIKLLQQRQDPFLDAGRCYRYYAQSLVRMNHHARAVSILTDAIGQYPDRYLRTVAWLHHEIGRIFYDLANYQHPSSLALQVTLDRPSSTSITQQAPTPTLGQPFNCAVDAFEQSLGACRDAIAQKQCPPNALCELQLRNHDYLMRHYVHAGQKKNARQHQREGAGLLAHFLETVNSDLARRDYDYQFRAFNQFTIDDELEKGNIAAALEAAESEKVNSLSWMHGENLSVGDGDWIVPEDTCILYWHLTPQSIISLVLDSRGGPTHVVNPTSTQDLSQLCHQWKQQILGTKTLARNEQDRHQLSGYLTRLRRLLCIDQIHEHLQTILTSKSRRIVIIPHDDLHLFPIHHFFEDIDGRPYDVTYMPCLASIRTLQGVNAGELDGIHRMLMVVNPTGDLDNSDHEGVVIGEIMSQRTEKLCCLQTHNATRRNVDKVLKQLAPTVFHYSGHALSDPDSPYEGGLLLHDRDVYSIRDVLNALESSAGAQLRLVALAACETAVVGNQSFVERYVGLTSAFLRHNASYVMSALWPVTDEASSLLMMRFYHQYQKTGCPVKSLRRARIWLKSLNSSKLKRLYGFFMQQTTFRISEIRQQKPDEYLMDERYLSYCRILNFLAAKLSALPSTVDFDHVYYSSSFTITGC